MVVDGYWLVRPGSESEVERARSRAHDLNGPRHSRGTMGS